MYRKQSSASGSQSSLLCVGFSVDDNCEAMFPAHIFLCPLSSFIEIVEERMMIPKKSPARQVPPNEVKKKAANVEELL